MSASLLGAVAVPALRPARAAAARTGTPAVTLMNPKNLFGTVDVVDDLAAVQQWYTAIVGRTWQPVRESSQTVRTSAGTSTVDLRWSYSAEDIGHRIRLVQSIPGTLWTPASSGLHHHIYLSDDVDADVAALVANGASEEVRAIGGARTAWAYCKSPIGIRIEFLDRRQSSLLPVAGATSTTKARS